MTISFMSYLANSTSTANIIKMYIYMYLLWQFSFEIMIFLIVLFFLLRCFLFLTCFRLIYIYSSDKTQLKYWFSFFIVLFLVFYLF